MSELATVTRAAPRGMITLRGDLADPTLNAAVKEVTGFDVPASRGIVGDGEASVAWMSPDEVLVMVPYGSVKDAVDTLDRALDGVHALAVDVSDARALFELRGSRPRDLLARLCPVDLHVDQFSNGTVQRTRLAQVAAAFWVQDAGFDVICFRSVADYVEDLLLNAAHGAPVAVLD